MTFEQILAYIIPIFVWIPTIAITIRLIIRKQSVPAMLSWLMVIYVFPVVGIIAYLIFGEINLGKRRAIAFEQLKPKYMDWFTRLSYCDNLVNTRTNLLYRPIFDLANTPWHTLHFGQRIAYFGYARKHYAKHHS